MNGLKAGQSRKRKASESLEKPSDGSINHALEMLQWILSPVTIEDFLGMYWEKKALVVNRKNPLYFKKLVSLKAIDEVLRKDAVLFTENVDITSYTHGERKTLNGTGRATATSVWESYKEGCSVRFLNPQIFFKEIHTLDATLQEYFECMVGSNMYLTPANSQGFAPHYDDIEAFILQVEGKKRWRLYEPRNPEEYLPRVSSRNFTQEEAGEPFMDVVLEPGDLLYFPRGTIHQAHTVEDHHSLHLTISTYQKYSWADFLERVVPAALSIAIESDPEFRRGLPLGLASYAGVSHSDQKCKKREEFLQKSQEFFGKLFKYAPLDDAVDQMQKQFQHDALPPVLTASEKMKTVSSFPHQFRENGDVMSTVKRFSADTRFRLLRKNIFRIVMEEETVRLYYHVNNSKIYHEYESVFLEVDSELAPVAEKLLHAYPQFLSATEMNIPEVSRKDCLSMLTSLWEHELLMLEKPL
ncbi:bifunctional lysine-specific demethylase and histidyl-hydroxylase NO66 [Phlebotomus argentipes]|uniref:bifunctional lysine-specific demethylase and histidyl-hydroxylase NO66 n=1 Tax=Phlebotomus argentipes TaxID=94469 RepID=UPI002892EA09|nr:bifunctional lysine-specific demethylase and histidyl-hydroxylase NO66 [Phlebotomus argentipes]